MNNELKYHGKTLKEMSDNELNQQYVLNKRGMVLKKTKKKTSKN